MPATDVASILAARSSRVPRMRRYILSAALLLVFGMLAGCGQKGPLYLPTRAAAPASASSAPAAATSAARPAGAATVVTPASAASGG